MLSMKLLAFAMDFWSKGQLKALFLEHEVNKLKKTNLYYQAYVKCATVYTGHAA